MPSICFSYVSSSYLTPALKSAKPKLDRNNLNLTIKYASNFTVILKRFFMWGSGNVPGKSKTLYVILSLPSSFLSAPLRRRLGELRTRGARVS